MTLPRAVTLTWRLFSPPVVLHNFAMLATNETAVQPQHSPSVLIKTDSSLLIVCVSLHQTLCINVEKQTETFQDS